MAGRRSWGLVVTVGAVLAVLVGGGFRATTAAFQDAPFTVAVAPGQCGTAGSAIAGDIVATPAMVAAPQVSTVSVVLETTIDQLLAQPQVLVVEMPGPEVATGVACGVIAGPPSGDRLVVAVWETETGGLAGIAVIRPEGDTRVLVEAYLVLDAAGNPTGEDDSQDVIDDQGDDDDPDDDDPEGGV